MSELEDAGFNVALRHRFGRICPTAFAEYVCASRIPGRVKER